MTADFVNYRRDIGLLCGLQDSLDQSLARATTQGDSDLRQAENQLAHVKAQTKKAEIMLREATARLDRATARSGLVPSVPPPGTSWASTSVAEIVEELMSVSRDLDRAERSVDWVKTNRPQVATAGVHRTTGSTTEVPGSTAAKAGAGQTVPNPAPAEPERSKALWLLVGLAVVVLVLLAIALGA